MGIRKTERNDQHYAFLLLLCVCHSAITLALRPARRLEQGKVVYR